MGVPSEYSKYFKGSKLFRNKNMVFNNYRHYVITVFFGTICHVVAEDSRNIGSQT